MTKNQITVTILFTFVVTGLGCNQSENVNPAAAVSTPPTSVTAAPAAAPAPAATATPPTQIAKPVGAAIEGTTAPPAASSKKKTASNVGDTVDPVVTPPGTETDTGTGEVKNGTPTLLGKLGELKLPTTEEARNAASQQLVGPKAIRMFYGLIDAGRTTQAVAMMNLPAAQRPGFAKSYDRLESAKVTNIQEWERASWPAGQEKYMVTANLKCKPDGPQEVGTPPCGGYGDGPDTRFFTIKQGSIRLIDGIATSP